jgi:hypothetical protein
LAEQAPDRLVVATKVVGSVVPPLPSATGNSGEGQAVAEVAISKVVSEPQVGAASDGDDVVMMRAKQTTPPPSRDHEVVTPEASETLVPTTALAGGGATEVLASGALSTINFEVIDLDTTKLPSNDRDIYEAVPERMLADSVESEVEVPEAAASAAATSAEVVTSASGEPVPGVVAAGEPTLGQAEMSEVSRSQPCRKWQRRSLGSPR